MTKTWTWGHWKLLVVHLVYSMDCQRSNKWSYAILSSRAFWPNDKDVFFLARISKTKKQQTNQSNPTTTSHHLQKMGRDFSIGRQRQVWLPFVKGSYLSTCRYWRPTWWDLQELGHWCHRVSERKNQPIVVCELWKFLPKITKTIHNLWVG